jgi:hypothetical protein
MTEEEQREAIFRLGGSNDVVRRLSAKNRTANRMLLLVGILTGLVLVMLLRAFGV